jgi:hypothetical protein
MTSYREFMKAEMAHKPAGTTAAQYMKVIGQKWKSKKGGCADSDGEGVALDRDVKVGPSTFRIEKHGTRYAVIGSTPGLGKKWGAERVVYTARTKKACNEWIKQQVSTVPPFLHPSGEGIFDTIKDRVKGVKKQTEQELFKIAIRTKLQPIWTKFHLPEELLEPTVSLLFKVLYRHRTKIIANKDLILSLLAGKPFDPSVTSAVQNAIVNALSKKKSGGRGCVGRGCVGRGDENYAGSISEPTIDDHMSSLAHAVSGYARKSPKIMLAPYDL